MGITNPFDGGGGKAENTCLGEPVDEFDEVAEPEDDGLDVEAFANFMRATRAPGRGKITQQVRDGEFLFTIAACNVCHTPRMVTAPAGTRVNGGKFVIPSALGNKIIRPFSDFALHDIGTGDGIVQNGGQATRNMLRTPALWGLGTRNGFMHDRRSVTITEAILRHAGQATFSRQVFNQFNSEHKADLIAFLRSL
jgi:CxxC motif-containing protein (DUF1111 family)